MADRWRGMGERVTRHSQARAAMTQNLVVALIADTSNPGAAARLLDDLDELASLDRGLGRITVVVLENPACEDATMAEFRAQRVHLRVVARSIQKRDAARGHFGRIALTAGRLPIATARRLVKRYAVDHTDAYTAVWVLDEDLRLTPMLDAIAAGRFSLSQCIRHLRASRIDIAVGPVIGAPPVPARSTVRVNLEDVLRHLDIIAALHPDTVWPDRTAENAQVRIALPEYYYDLTRAHEDPASRPMWLEPDTPGESVRSVFARLSVAAGQLLDGVPVTRAVRHVAINGQTCKRAVEALYLGGNTLIVRPDLLAKIPSIAPRLGGRVTRRSDMLWARLAVAYAGAQVGSAPLTALQDRTGPGRSSFGLDKLLDDVRGSAAVAALDTFLGGESLSRAADVYAMRVNERVAQIRQSEERVRQQLVVIDTQLDTPGHRIDFLAHPCHDPSVARLREAVWKLRQLHACSFEPGDLVTERAELKQFLSDLPEELTAYRMAVEAPGRFQRGPTPGADTGTVICFGSAERRPHRFCHTEPV
ncbi:MAG: hypothetical protein AAGC55_05785 [Myxococcota bacterium]